MALLPLLFALVLALSLGAGAAAVRRSPVSLESTVVAARRHAALTAATARTLGLVAAVGTAVTGAFSDGRAGAAGLTVLLVPVVYAVVHTVVLAVGELTWPRPAGDVRRAGLVRRGLLDAAPRRLLRPAVGAAAVAALVLVAGGLLGGPDGRSFTYTVGNGGEGTLSQSASPFPGWFYGLPTAAGLSVVAALAVAALWVVATRPAVVTDDARIEQALRRASAHRVLQGALAALLFDTGGLLFVSGTAMPDIGPAWLGALAVVLMVVGAAMVLASAVAAFLPAPRVPADAPALVG
ncbi:hypothetical protein GCU60_16845 [Blastococcus saxobsidens]|uniref:Uncharacterized protein n=1 Tax=Blastococcus saxobsidens TaxID=138336 RepID=A0A6L9W6H6_9ACTN|nr:hypothetical protein [Blastococcus saxobsidens]NEK87409.1 hypothetical protein [Blastococcus saxobsidens]